MSARKLRDLSRGKDLPATINGTVNFDKISQIRVVVVRVSRKNSRGSETTIVK